MMPRLLILGAQKAGTTTLFDILVKHPMVLPPVRKELHFFDRDEEYRKGMRHYRSLFPPVPIRSSGHVTLEASPSYLYLSDICAPRIARHVPRAMCMILLRDPVLRAFSAWNMCRQFAQKPHPTGIPEYRTFQAAVEDELAERTVHWQHRYLAKGYYLAQVEDYQRHIGQDKLLIRTFVELKREPAQLINEVCDRLGIHRMAPSHEAFRTRSNVRTYEERLDPGLNRELQTHFAPLMQRLHTVLGYEPDLNESASISDHR